MWSSNRCLKMCDNALRDKVREMLVAVLKLESDGPLVLKKTLESIMDVDNSALRSLTEPLQNLRTKNFAEKNVDTEVSNLKGVLLLLKKCSAIPTNVMG